MHNNNNNNNNNNKCKSCSSSPCRCKGGEKHKGCSCGGKGCHVCKKQGGNSEKKW